MCPRCKSNVMPDMANRKGWVYCPKHGAVIAKKGE